MSKTNYHILADLLSAPLFDPEITEKLDLIAQVADLATPLLPEDAP